MKDFPDEIWEYVFSNFECKVLDRHWPHDRLTDWKSFYNELRAISCVCQRSRHIAQRSIYRSILIRLEPSQQQLVSDLRRNPQLGQIVRQICLRDVGGDYDYTTNAFMRLSFKTAASAITAPSELKKAIFYEIDHNQAMATCILLLTPRVRVLDLDITPSRRNSCIIRWLLSGTLREDGDYHPNDFELRKEQQTPASSVENATPKALYFHELEELRLCIRTRSAGYPIDAFDGVLFHPKLKTLSLTKFAWLVDKPEKLRWGSVSSLLTRLELHNCRIEPSTLSHILTRCKNLKHLTIDLHRHSKLMSVYEMNLYDFGDVLRELGGNLETLLFSTKAVEEFEGYSTWPTMLGCLRNLKELSSLQHLSINRINIGNPPISEDAFEDGSETVLADALPHSLKTLHLITERGMWRELADDIEYTAFHESENEQVCNLLLAECCPELCRVDITRITSLANIEGNRFEITSELGDRWHVERTPDEEAWNGIGIQLHTALWKCG